jgi:Ni/Co efflux regulator RcnB
MMKRVLAASFALSLLGGASALAQPDNQSGGDHHAGGWNGQHGGAPGAGPRGGGAPNAAPAAPRAPSAPAPAATIGGAPGWRNGAGANPNAGARAPGGQGNWQGGGQFHPLDAGRNRGGAPNTPESDGWRGGGRPDDVNPRGGPNGDNLEQRHWNGGQPGWRGDGGNDARGGYRPSWGAPGFMPGGQRPRYNPQYFPRTFYPEHRYHWRGEWYAPNGFYYRHWGYGDRLPYGWYDQDYWIDDYYDYELPVPPYGYAWVRLGPDAVLVDLSNGMVVETVYSAFY